MPRQTNYSLAADDPTPRTVSSGTSSSNSAPISPQRRCRPCHLEGSMQIQLHPRLCHWRRPCAFLPASCSAGIVVPSLVSTFPTLASPVCSFLPFLPSHVGISSNGPATSSPSGFQLFAVLSCHGTRFFHWSWTLSDTILGFHPFLP